MKVFYDERKAAAKRFGENMEALRKAMRISRDELAEASGVSKSSIDNYAVGRCEPTALAITRIADVLECSTDWLLGRDRP